MATVSKQQVFNSVKELNYASLYSNHSIDIAADKRHAIKKYLDKNTLAYKIIDEMPAKRNFTQKQLWVITFELCKNAEYCNSLTEAQKSFQTLEDKVESLRNTKGFAEARQNFYNEQKENREFSKPAKALVKAHGLLIKDYQTWLKSHNRKEFYSKRFSVETAKEFIKSKGITIKEEKKEEKTVADDNSATESTTTTATATTTETTTETNESTTEETTETESTMEEIKKLTAEQLEALDNLESANFSLKQNLGSIITDGDMSIQELIVAANKGLEAAGLKKISEIPESYEDFDIDCTECLTSWLRDGMLDELNPDMDGDEFTDQLTSWQDEIRGKWQEIIDAIDDYLFRLRVERKVAEEEANR